MSNESFDNRIHAILRWTALGALSATFLSITVLLCAIGYGG